MIFYCHFETWHCLRAVNLGVQGYYPMETAFDLNVTDGVDRNLLQCLTRSGWFLYFKDLLARPTN